MSEPIHQEIVFEADADRIYGVLTDAGQFSAMSGAPARIDGQEGSAFSCFDGWIVGRNLECVPGKRLVQAWRVKNWDPGVYSIVRFELFREDDHTRVVLDHTGFPEDQATHLDGGWHKKYWEPLRQALSNLPD